MAGSLLASAIPRCSAKNSSVLTRILSNLNKPVGRPACRRTASDERPSSFSFRGSVDETRNRLLMGSLTASLYLFLLLLFSVLIVGDMLHPVDDLAIFLLLNCDMCHADARRGAVPVFFAREKPDHVTRTALLDRPAPAPSPAQPRRADERLDNRKRGATSQGD